jgi:hypothetical protein
VSRLRGTAGRPGFFETTVGVFSSPVCGWANTPVLASPGPTLKVAATPISGNPTRAAYRTLALVSLTHTIDA